MTPTDNRVEISGYFCCLHAQGPNISAVVLYLLISAVSDPLGVLDILGLTVLCSLPVGKSERPDSSTGKSNGLLSRRLWVRVPLGAPPSESQEHDSGENSASLPAAYRPLPRKLSLLPRSIGHRSRGSFLKSRPFLGNRGKCGADVLVFTSDVQAKARATFNELLRTSGEPLGIRSEDR